MGFYKNDATAANNTSVNGIAVEGTSSPANIDNALRELAAQGKQFALDIAGANTVGGTADAITITANDSVADAYFDGMIIGFVAGSDNATTSPTANVNAIGAKTIKKALGSDGAELAVAAGDIQSGGLYLLRYRSAWASAAGAWQLIDLQHPAAVSGPASATDDAIVLFDGATGKLIQNSLATINSSGDLTIPDKIIHSGDTNTAIRFPGADTVTVETAGSERMRIDSSGSVAIGTTSVPGSCKFRVSGSDAAAIGLVNGASYGVRFGSASGVGGYVEAVDAGGVTSYQPLVVGGSELRFNTSTTERMRITSAGTVGIGTSTPSYTLHVNGSFGVSTGRGQFLGFQNVGTMLTSTSALGGAEFTSAGASDAAFMAFHRPGGFGTYFGLDTDNYIAVGGWSSGAGLGGFKCGALSKTSGSFKIDHPLKPDTHWLVHSFVEGPQADNIYRGKVALVSGTATVNIDEAARMTEGTFVALNGNVQCFTTNEDGWTAVRGKVNGNILTIEAQDAACTDTVSWLVIGERHDQHMLETNWTDEQGRVITEPEKETKQ